ncbi:MAG TPA: DNA repair protein RadC [Methanospirillum sp.]|nr:DNA repair protein RadC [Methanospirillum sp.]
MAPKRMRDIEEQDRPREKIEHRGAQCLSDTELIAAIIGKGTQRRDVLDISREVAGKIHKEKILTYEELVRIEGIGPSKASVLMACFEMARRYGTAEEEPAVKITTPADVLDIPEVREIRGKKQELFLTITLNGASEVIRSRLITMGLLNHSLVHPREVFSDAIVDRAASIICIHNHPSGTLQPSNPDIQITRQLVSAGEILGIGLIDHIIVAKGGLVSLRELGYL